MCAGTDSGGIAVLYILGMDLIFYRALWKVSVLTDLFIQAGRSAAQILFLIACASLFSWVLHQARLTETLGTLLLSMTQNRILLLLLVNGFLLLAGCFIDAISIMYIFVPIFLPVMRQVGVDPIHFGLILTVNLAIGQVTPPVGVNLFVASTFSGLDMGELSRAVIPFVCAELFALALVTFIPPISLAIPNLYGGI